MALIGAVLIQPEAIAELADTLPVEAFGTTKAAFCYRGMLRLWDRRSPADFAMLSAELDTMGVKDRSSLTDYLVACMQTEHGGFRYAGHLAEQVKRLAYLRSISDGAAALVRAVHADSEAFDLDAQVAELQQSAQRFAANGSSVMTLPEQLALAQAKAEGRWDGSYDDRVVPTGLAMLNRMFNGGFRTDDFIVIAGRPGMGKTAFALHLARQCRALFVTLEMPAEAILNRLIAAEAGVPFAVGVSKIGDIGQRRRWIEAAERLAYEPLMVREDLKTTAQIQAEVERLRREDAIDLVVIDHLDWLEDRFKLGTSQYDRVSALSRRATQIVKATKVPVVMLSQLNRDVEHRPGCTPYLSDLRDSGKVEQDATGIILLYTRAYYASRGMGGLKPEHEKDYILGHPTWDRMSLSIAKNRNGMTGGVDCGWEGKVMKVHDVEVAA